MIAQRHARVAASGFIVLAFAGLWIGHTLEYLRVWGTAGLVDSLTSPVHIYMLPLAGVLATLGAAFGFRLVRTWRTLNARLVAAAYGIRRVWRGGRADAVSPSRASFSPAARLGAIWVPLAAAQIALYLIQENVEAIAHSQAAPGLGPVTGVHWAAPLVHLYVSLLLACGVRICQVLLRRRAAVVERAEALLRAAVSWLRRAVSTGSKPAPDNHVSPLDCIGLHLWRRPPPQLLGV